MGRAHLTAVAPQLQRYNQVGRYPKHPQSHLPLSHTCHRLKLDLEEKNASDFAFLKLPLQCSPFGYLAPKERLHLQLDCLGDPPSQVPIGCSQYHLEAWMDSITHYYVLPKGESQHERHCLLFLLLPNVVQEDVYIQACTYTSSTKMQFLK